MKLTSIRHLDLIDGFPHSPLLSTLSARYDDFLRTPLEVTDRAPGIHASEVSGCPRRMVYSLSGTKRVDRSPLVWKKRFKVGHALHSMLQTDFHNLADNCDDIFFEEEIPINSSTSDVAKQWDINSRADGVFTFIEKGSPVLRVLLEIKTKSPDEFSKLKEPDEEHVEQAHVYMASLDLPVTWFLYWNKGNQNYTGTDLKPFLYKFDQKIWSRLEERFAQAHMHVAEGTLPAREESILCEICSFSHTCKPKYLQKKMHVDSRGIIP